MYRIVSYKIAFYYQRK